MEPLALDPATLLAQDHRLRSLARALVRDAHAADDLAQETWLAALESRAGLARTAILNAFGNAGSPLSQVHRCRNARP